MSNPDNDQLLEIVHERDVKEKRYAFHAHNAREVLAVLGSRIEGLSGKEVRERQAEYGSNQFTPEKTTSFIERVITQLASPLALVLVVAFFVTFALQEFIDAGVIALALLVAVVVGVLQEGKASRAFHTLSDSQVRKATVWRDGRQREIEASELVPGDIVVLQNGARVPADVRLLSTKQLYINEAALTGEWASVEKQTAAVVPGTVMAEQASMAWMGTFVAEGHGTGVVVAIGDDTEVGMLASSVRGVEEVDTPLQAEMKALSHKMLIFICVVVLIIFSIGIWRGLGMNEMLLISIAIAVASIPEGLPAAVTIILAVGMEALLKRGGLVRNLLAAETLGSTTYVLTDKTGTLTEATMSVTHVLVHEGVLVSIADMKDDPAWDHLFEVSMAATDAYTEETHGKSIVRGEAAERAIVYAARERGLSDLQDSYRARRTDNVSFTSEQRFAAGLVPDNDEFILCINGAPDRLLADATHYASTDGPVQLTDDVRSSIIAAIAEETSVGKRLIGVGYKTVSYDDIPEEDTSLLHGIVFAGVLVMADPVRKGVAAAIAGVQAAGARVILITGDNPQTALSIAAEVGIVAADDDGVLTGAQLETLTDDELLVAVDKVSVFARVLPKQKMRIASVLQQRGEIVAMTGDGINDAPALRRANIGIAIGSGTEVAKEASDLVLMNDSFATIYAAIEEGRRIVSNLRKIVGYLLSTSLSEVVLIAAALLTGGVTPLVPAQILWANIIEEGLMSVAFAFEKGSKNVMKQKPRDIHADGLVSKNMFWFIVFVVTILSILNLALYFVLRGLALSDEDLRSVMFLAIAMDSLFISFAFRSLTTPVWKIPLTTNKFFIISFLISAALFATVLTIPFMQYLLSYQPQPLGFILLAIASSVLSLITIEIGKFIFFDRART